jgi:SAM-dependent MidA family methyltransferase
MNISDNVAMQHSQKLIAHIIQQINSHGGQISFTDFMQAALYAPGLGYYSVGTTKFGAAGDFVTAPELGTLFAKCLAVQCTQILTLITHKNIFELGAGSGQLACDLLQALAQQNIELDNYFILELSADLRQRQQEKIFEQCPEFCNIVHWLDELPSTPIDAVIIANEVVDAMPIARFHFENDILQEYYIKFDDSGLKEILATPSNYLQNAFTTANLAKYISQPYVSELNLWLHNWLHSLNSSLASGAILIADYGFPRAEYYHPQRNQGTLMCHYQHRSHTNPLINIGLQDITAHVDFTAVAEAAAACGLEIAGYTNQASFLLNCGIIQFLEFGNLKQHQELQTLTSPAEMGELFKIVALTKNIEKPLLGFENFDKQHSL